MKNIIYGSIFVLISLLGNNFAEACTTLDLDYTFTTAEAGTTVTVTWTSTGCAPGSLLDVSLIDITANAVVQYYPGNSNTGSLVVTLGAGLAPGPYQFYIQYAPSWPPVVWDYGPTFQITLPLPIELLSFSGEESLNKSVELKWSTASESNNNGFEIEHSIDGREWKTLDFVAGKGNSTTVQNYSFLDESPERAENYYRLKQLDFDGAFSYSDLIRISIAGDDLSYVIVFPNPSSDFIKLTGAESQAINQYQIFDINGVIVMSQNNEATRIDISPLSTGIYWIEIIDGRNEKAIIKFIKE